MWRVDNTLIINNGTLNWLMERSIYENIFDSIYNKFDKFVSRFLLAC